MGPYGVAKFPERAPTPVTRLMGPNMGPFLSTPHKERLALHRGCTGLHSVRSGAAHGQNARSAWCPPLLVFEVFRLTTGLCGDILSYIEASRRGEPYHGG